MNEFPSNSRRSKMTPSSEPKKVERVITGEVVLRKRPWTKRALDAFFGGNPHGVGGFVVAEVLLPAFREVFVEALNSAVERMVYGESSRSSPGRRGPYSSSSQRSGYVQYNRFATSQQSNRFARDEPRDLGRRPRGTHDTDEILFQTRAEAQEVLTRMYDLLNEYEQVTVSDLYSMVDITGNYTDETLGWLDLRGTEIMKVRGGYILDLPPKVELKP